MINIKILCIGHAAYDITIPISKFIQENTKNRVNERITCGGGPAATAAYLLGKWGSDVTFMGLIGNDINGKKILKEFKSVNVDTTYVEKKEKYETATSYIIANKENGSRTILTYQKEKMPMQDVDIDFVPNIILIDGEEYELSKKMLEKYKTAISVIDAGKVNAHNLELCEMVDYLVCSKEFAENISNMKFDFENKETLKRIFLYLKERFHNNIVITLENKGCLYEIDNEIRIMNAIKVEAIDSTGAGDIFHGAFVYGLSINLPYEKVIKLAVVTSGLSVTRLGGRNSIFELDEIKEKYEEFR